MKDDISSITWEVIYSIVKVLYSLKNFMVTKGNKHVCCSAVAACVSQ